MDEALGNLEEIAVGLVGHEIDGEVLSAVGSDLNLGRGHIEGISNLLARSFVCDLEEGPVDAHGEHKFVVESKRLRFALPSRVSETEIDVVDAQLELTFAA